MASITLPEIEADVLKELQAIARARNTTVEEEIVDVLRERFRMERRREIRRRADAIAAMTPKDVVQTDSTILVREDRDA